MFETYTSSSRYNIKRQYEMVLKTARQQTPLCEYQEPTF